MWVITKQGPAINLDKYDKLDCRLKLTPGEGECWEVYAYRRIPGGVPDNSEEIISHTDGEKAALKVIQDIVSDLCGWTAKGR